MAALATIRIRGRMTGEPGPTQPASHLTAVRPPGGHHQRRHHPRCPRWGREACPGGRSGGWTWGGDWRGGVGGRCGSQSLETYQQTRWTTQSYCCRRLTLLYLVLFHFHWNIETTFQLFTTCDVSVTFISYIIYKYLKRFVKKESAFLMIDQIFMSLQCHLPDCFGTTILHYPGQLLFIMIRPP